MQIGIRRSGTLRVHEVAERPEGLFQRFLDAIHPAQRYICVQENGGVFKCQRYTSRIGREIIRKQKSGVNIRYYFCFTFSDGRF